MEKIILGTKKFAGNQNTDEFIDIELNREIETLKIDSLNNTFDFQDQFIKERNNSLNFCLYGMVESRYGQCDDLSMKISIRDTNPNSNSTPSIIYTQINFSATTSGYSETIHTKSLSFNNELTKNIYGTNKGCYFFYFQLDKFEHNFNTNKSIYIEIFEPFKEMYGNFSIPFLFFNEDESLVEFGTETAEYNANNQIETINNNFPFFYDKHWIKFNIEPIGPQIVFFDESEIIVSEDTAQNLTIPISLENPSLYGLEKVKLIVDYNFNDYGELLTTANLNTDFIFKEQILSWNIGEKTKNIPIEILNDLFVENIEKIQFRLIPLLNSRIDINTNNSMILYINSEDTPVSAHFDTDFYEVIRPQFNYIHSSNYVFLDININFSNKLPVAGEKIKINFKNTKSSAILNQDFLLDPANLNVDVKELIKEIPISADSISFQIKIYEHKGYINDKKIILELEQETLGVVPISQSNVSLLPETTITIKDSTKYKYTRFILPFDNNNNNGIFKTIFMAGGQLTNPVILSKDNLNGSGSISQSQPNVTNNFSCKLKITNLGEQIVKDNNLILTNESYTVDLNLSAITNNLILDIPSNYNWLGTYYNQCYYDFEFIDISRTFPTGITESMSEIYDNINKLNSTILKSVHTAGDIGKQTKYLITELTNAYSTYDESTEICNVDAIVLNNNIKYNGAILTSLYNYSTTKNKLYFSENLVVEECKSTGNTLPVGTTLLPAGPYNEKYARLNFGKVFTQINYNLSDLNTKMYLDAPLNNNVFLNSYKFFRYWNATITNTQTSIQFQIKNNGLKSVTLLNKIINPNSTQTYSNAELNFNNLSFVLPANDNYDSLKNYFTKYNYSFKILNIKIPNSIIGNTTFMTIDEVNLAHFNETSDFSSQSSINYFLENKYNDIVLSATLFGNLQCNIPLLFNHLNVTKRIITNDILLFINAGSELKSSTWSKSVISPDCPTSTILFKVF